MKVKVLVNLFDEHNEGSLLAIEKLKPLKVIYIRNSETNDIYNNIRVYTDDVFKNIQFESIVVKTGDIKSIETLLNKLPVNETIINVTGGKRINSLILLNRALIKGFRAIYVDVLNKKWYELNDEITKSEREFSDINLENMLKITGADLVVDSTTLSEKEDIIDITKNIYKHLDLWYEYKQKLYDGRIFKHDAMNPESIKIQLDILNDNEINILKSSLSYLKNKNGIEFKYCGNEIKVDFLNDYLKGFIFKSGTWLEVLTNIVVREIREIDEVRSGVVFLWNEGRSRVRNELDVLAVKDSVLICISCKDSEKYDENALNELEVYSKRLGGNAAKKILVATRLPCKHCVVERAKAMGINLVILDKDINKFKNYLKKVINN